MERYLEISENRLDNRVIFWNLLFGTGSLLCMIFPAVQGYLAGSYYRLVMIIMMVGWTITALMDGGIYYFLKISTQMIIIYLLVAFYAVLAFLGYGNIRESLITVVCPYYAGVMCLYYYQRGMLRQFSLIGWSVAIAYIFTFLTTIIGMSTDVYVTREIRGVVSSAEYYQSNIGGMGFVYAAALCLMLFLCILQSGNVKSMSMKIFLTVGSVIGAWLVLVGSSGITLLGTFCAMTLFFIQRWRKYNKVFFIITLITLLLTFSGLIAQWLMDISEYIDNLIISSKIYDIGMPLISGDATGSAADRTTRWIMDINTGLRTWMIGCGPIYQGSAEGWFFDNKVYFVADHSQLFADFARYGICFTGYIVYMFWRFSKLYHHMAQLAELNIHFDSFWLLFAIMYISQPIYIGFVIPILIMFMVQSSIFMVNFSNDQVVYAKKG